MVPLGRISLLLVTYIMLTMPYDANKINKFLKYIIGEVIHSLLFRVPIVKKTVRQTKTYDITQVVYL